MSMEMKTGNDYAPNLYNLNCNITLIDTCIQYGQCTEYNLIHKQIRYFND